MNELLNTFTTILEFYNNYFWHLIEIMIFFSIFILFVLFVLDKSHLLKSQKIFTFYHLLSREFMQISAELAFTLPFLLIIKESFGIDLLKISPIEESSKLIIGIWLLGHIKSALYTEKQLNFNKNLEIIENSEDDYSKAKLKYLNIIKQYKTCYNLEIEKLGILKSIAPIYLPIAVSFLFDNEKVDINWNNYTIIVLGCTFYYLYKYWKCYDKLKYLSFKRLEVEKKLAEFNLKNRKKVILKQRKIKLNKQLSRPLLNSINSN